MSKKMKSKQILEYLFAQVGEDCEWIFDRAARIRDDNPKLSTPECFRRAMWKAEKLERRAEVLRFQAILNGGITIQENPLNTTPTGQKLSDFLMGDEIPELCCQDQSCWHEPHNIGDADCRFVLIHGEVIRKDEIQDTTTIPMVIDDPERCDDPECHCNN